MSSKQANAVDPMFITSFAQIAVISFDSLSQISLNNMIAFYFPLFYLSITLNPTLQFECKTTSTLIFSSTDTFHAMNK